MTSTRARIRRFREETEASSMTVERVEARVFECSADTGLRETLALAPDARSGANDRVLGRLAPRFRARPSRLGPVWVLLPAAAALTLVIGGLSLRPAEPIPLEARLDSPASSTPLSPTPDVRLSYTGNGHVGGTDRNIAIDWESGVLDVDVTPGQGVHLGVATREAQVEVKGTAFRVTRDALGTRVHVDRGKVEVTCTGTESALLEAGGDRLCLPVSAAGWLGRALSLHAKGAALDDVKEAASRALSSEDATDVVRGEALAERMRVALDLHDYAGALADAEAYLAMGGPRAEPIRHLAAGLAFEAGGCAAAAPHLWELALTEPERARFSDCLGGQ